MGFKARNDNKTVRTSKSVSAFVDGLSDESRRRDSRILLDLYARVCGEQPALWGEAIIGYGSYHYHYKERSGRQGDWPRAGFSPRKSAMTLYFMPGFSKMHDLLGKLGPHKHSVSCLYIRSLANVDLDVLEKMLARSWGEMNERYPTE